MPWNLIGALRRYASAVFVVVLSAGLFAFAQLPEAAGADRRAVASRYHFTELPIALPAGLADNKVRKVNPRYEHIRAWISSVGAGIAINDLDGGRIANDLCLVDPRSDSVIITPAPGTAAKYQPFVLKPGPLPVHGAMAPMGCAPGDFNLDGNMDILVYFWGRTPIVYLHRGEAKPLSQTSFTPTELIANAPSATGKYQGQQWNTNAVAIADFDGDGKPDIGVFNYFPDTGVLDPHGAPNVKMNHSMSRATNAGGAHVLRWTAASVDSVAYEEQPAIEPSLAGGWTLGSSSADLDGDLLPELYLANDFGQDRLFHNVSSPGQIRFALVEGKRGPFDPKSLVLGNDSFKGMSIEFGDLDRNGRFDMFVSNITTSWGLEESNLVWMNTSTSDAGAAATMKTGEAPFENQAASKNLAWVGWGWDAKMADFDNSGSPVIVQACGFVQGTINRFNWLQELAMVNDTLMQEPDMWPNAEPGDDISGHEPMAFWAKEDGADRYVNISEELGMINDIPSRGIAISDTNGDGWQDFAVARQWGVPQFFRNDNANRLKEQFVALRLYRPVATSTPGARATLGTPAYGAQVRLTGLDGRTQAVQLDGGGGHSGKRSFDVFFGLGSTASGPVSVELRWRDMDGRVQSQWLTLSPGWHDLVLTDKAQEVTVR